MRIFRILILLLILNYSFLIDNTFSQWVQQNSGTSVNLYDVEFINKYTGWALGDGGIIIKTTNGGENWLNIPNPSMTGGGILFSIHPVDSNFIYVTGGHEIILKTTNGGLNWIEIRNGPFGVGTGYEGVYFLNKDTGWFTGYMKVLRTLDGGQTFDSAGIPWVDLPDIYFKDFNTGLVCTWGSVFKSTNGGLNWYNTNVPTQGIQYPFMKLSVVNDQYIWVIAGGNPPVFRSSNFGDTWDSITNIPSYPPAVINCSYFSSENIGWAGGSYGYLYKTTNGGFNWLREETSSDQRFWSSLWFYNDTIGWGVGGAGKINYTTTGGQTMVNITKLENDIPDKFILYQNYPNPFNTNTVVKFDISKSSHVKLIIYNILGKMVKILVNEKLNAGSYKYNLDGSDYSSGVYLYKLEVGSYTNTLKMILVK